MASFPRAQTGQLRCRGQPALDASLSAQVGRLSPHTATLIRARLCGRSGNTKDTRGTAYVVYEDIYDAKAAADHLSGFNVANRYLIVLFYAPARQAKKLDQASWRRAKHHVWHADAR